ncbi:MAG: branched-chain amino acid ABC transporter permease [Armatimonadota bacterium]|nr:MAG: branched-chain amino acid ABC transporter permease [Armatimonadota bacterium]
MSRWQFWLWRVLSVGVSLVALLGTNALVASLRSAGWLDEYTYRVMMLCGINILLAVSLNLINGITGQFSIGHAGFQGVGAYTSAAFTVFVVSPWMRERGLYGTPIGDSALLIAGIMAGAVSASLAGLFVGIPSLRLRGDYLAIATLGFGEIIRVTILNVEQVGGARGFYGIPLLTTFFWLYLAVIVLLALSRNLLVSTQGLAFLAVRDDEIAAEAIGVHSTRIKVIAFVTGACFAGIAGALYAHFDGYLNPDNFRLDQSIIILTMVVLGGQGSITGSVLSSVLLTVVLEWLRFLPTITIGGRAFSPSELRMVFFSLMLILLMLWRQTGLLGRREFGWHVVRQYWRLLRT